MEITGGTLTVTGSTQITGTTLTLDGGTLGHTTLSTASGGTIQTASGATTTLDAATLAANTTLTVASGSTLDVADNLTLGSGATITVDAGGTLNFIDGTSNTQTISGSGTITLDAASGSYAAAQINADGANSGSQVTFANGVNITGFGTSTAPNTITAANGNTIAFDDTLTNATISSSGGYLQADGSYGSATVFDAVTLANDVSIGSSTYGSGAYLNVADGLTFQNGSILSFGGYFGTLAFVGGTSQSIQGSGTIALTTQANGTTVLSPFSGTLSVSSGSSVTIGSGVQITMGSATYGGGGYGGYGPPGSGSNSTTNITINGNLISDGAITSAGGDVTVGGSGTLTNSGGITVGTNGSTAANNTFTISADVQGYAAFNANGGVIDFSSGTSTLNAGSVLEASAGGSIELTGGTLAVDAAVSSNYLTMSGGTLTGNSSGSLTLTGTMAWNGGTISALPVTVANGAVLTTDSGGPSDTLAGTTLTIAAGGSASLGDSGLYMDSGSQIDNYGTFQVPTVSTNSTTFYSDGSSGLAFNNYNLLEKTGGTGAAIFNSNGVTGVALNNSGTVQVDTGTLEIQGGGMATGTFNASGGTINFDGYASNTTYTLNTGTTLEASNGGTIELTQGTLAVDAAVSTNNLTMSGGTLTGNSSGSLTLTGTMTWNGGTISGLPVTVGNGAALAILNGSGETLSGSNLTIASGGLVTLAMNMNLANNAQIENSAGGTFDILDNLSGFGNELYADSSSGLAFNNAGLLEKTGGTGATIFGSNGTTGVALNNSGTVQVDTGTLETQGGGMATGTFNASGGTINFDGYASNTTYTLNTGTTLEASNGGTIELTQGTLAVDAAVSTNNLTMSGGTLTGNSSGSLTLTGTMAWNGGTISALPVTVANGAMLTTDSGGQSDTLTGTTLTVLAGGIVSLGDSGLYMDSGSQIDNYGTFQIPTVGTNSTTFYSDGSSGLAFNNYNLLEQTGGTGAAIFNSNGITGVALNNSGTVQVDTGTVEIQSGGTATGTFNASGGTINFDGYASNTTYTLNTGTTLEASNGGTIELTQGTLAVDAAVSTNNLTVSGGTLEGGTNGTLTLTTLLGLPGVGLWNGGNISDLAMNIATGAVLTLGQFNTSTLSAGTLTIQNGGTVDVGAQGMNLAAAPLIDNQHGGTFDFVADGSVKSQDTSTPIFTNDGVLDKTGGTASAGSILAAELNNNSDGLVNAASGVLFLGGGGTDSGTIRATWGIVDFAGGTMTVTTGAPLVTVAIGQIEIGGGTLYLDSTVYANNWMFTGGTLAGATGADFIVDGVLSWSGATVTIPTEVSPGSTLVLYSGGTLDGTGLTNNGVISVQDGGSLDFTNGAILLNDTATAPNPPLGMPDTQDPEFLDLYSANGIIEIAGGGTFNSGDSSSTQIINGAGALIEVYGNTGASFSINVAIENYGTLSAVTGELDISGVGTAEVLEGALTATNGGILNIQGTWTLGDVQAASEMGTGSDGGYILVDASLTVSGGAYISTLASKPPTNGLPGAWVAPTATLWFPGPDTITLGYASSLSIGSGVTLEGNVGFAGGRGFYSPDQAGQAVVHGGGQILVANSEELTALQPQGYETSGGYTNSSGSYVPGPTWYYPPWVVTCGTGIMPSGTTAPSSAPPLQTVLGDAMAISPTEVVFGWDWNQTGTNPFTASGYTYSISYSTDGANFTTVATSLPHGNYYVFEHLRPGTYYYFQVDAVSPGGNVTSWRSGPTMTNGLPTNVGLGIASSTDQAGYYQITGVTDASGSTVAPGDYNAGIVYAGSQQGAVLISLQNLLSTSTSYVYYPDSNGNPIAYGPLLQNVAAQDSPGYFGAGYLSLYATEASFWDGITAAQWEQQTGLMIIRMISSVTTIQLGTDPPVTYNQFLAEGIQGLDNLFHAFVRFLGSGSPTPSSGGDPILDSTGATQIVNTDLTAGGFSGAWSVTRNWTPDASLVPDNTFGNAWMNQSQTYLQEFVGESDANPDIMLIHSTYWQTTFNYSSTSNTYSALGASTDTLVHDTANGTYIWTDESGADGNPIGSQRIYYDFSPAVPTYLQGKLKEYLDPFGNAINLTYNAGGFLTTVTQTDAAGDTETFAYSYNIDGQISLIQQSIQRAGDSAPTVFRQAVYSYYQGSYTGSDAYGNFGDLKTVTIEDGNGNVLSEDYYRYYTPADLNAGAQGYVGALMYSFSADSFTKLAAAFTDPFTATDAQIAPYADEAYTWNNQRQVVGEVVGSMGASANLGQGTYAFSYTFNPALQSMTYSNLNYNTWVTQATEILPDGNENLVYVNIDGNAILDINNTSTDPGNPANVGKNWITGYQYDSNGRLIDTISPTAINLNASILNGATTVPQLEAALSQYADAGLSEGLIQANTGLILSSAYYSSTTATGTAAGGVTGYLEADYVQQGSSGTPIEQDSYTYIAHTNYSGTTIYPEASYTQYQSSANNGSTPETTTYSYSWQNNVGNLSTNQIADLTTTNPVVSTGQNGSGTATSTQTVFNQFGQAVWTMDEKGYITYTAYDNATGAVIQSVEDVNTANLADLENYTGAYPGGTLAFGSNGYNQLGVPELPTGWITPAGGGLNLVTSYKVDNLGRPTEITSPNGNITLFVYDDVDHAVFTLTGVILNTSNDALTTTAPITMTRSRIPYTYSAGSQGYTGTYTETMTFSANTPISYTTWTGAYGGSTAGILPAFPGFNANGTFNLIGNGTSSAPQFTIQSLTRVLYNNSGRTAGQMVESDAYAAIDNATYLATAVNSSYSGAKITNQLSGQTPNGNYYATYYGYDADGRQYQIIDANGTINDTVYDSLGRVASDWVGTNDATNNGQPFTGSNAGTGNNMTEIESYVYDNGSVGDSNVTEVIQYPDGNTTGTQRVSVLNYDFRDRLVATETGLTLDSSGNPVTSSSDAYPQITVYTLDNLGDATATLTFNGAATTIANAIVAAASAAPGAVLAGLVGYSTSEYDSQNRDYEDQVYSVDPTTGTISTTALTSYTFYGPRGNVIETVAPTGLVTKNVYNGVNELVDTFTTDGGAVNNGGLPILTYAAAGSVANDVVVNQTAYGYDGDGNLIETVHAQRFNTDPITGTGAEGALFTDTVNSDGSLNVTPASNSNSSLGARIYYSATYYDAADREIATVNAGTNPVGTNGAATPWARPVTPGAPGSPVTSLITTYQYNSAGYLFETTDPRGIVAANFYNSLGETVETIAAYDPSVNGGNPTNDQNQTTLYTFDGLGDQTSMTAEDPSTGNQTTTYVYGVSTATGSSITSDDLLY